MAKLSVAANHTEEKSNLFGNIFSYRNIFNYLEEEKRSFREKPFGDADSLLFTQLAYMRLDGFVKESSRFAFSVGLKKLCEEETLNTITKNIRIPKDTRKLMLSALGSPRFRNIRFKYYSNRTDYKAEKQFSAITFLLEGNLAFVAFRGTDNSIVGWKENFNMAYMTPVPAQLEAQRYLTAVMRHMPFRKFIVGGHSKGGNLAIYASAQCPQQLQNRILRVYNHDGPGFKEDFLGSSGYQRIKQRIHTILPQSSMIGTLLTQSRDCRIVKSTGLGFEQHNPLRWVFTENDLTDVPSLSKEAMRMDKIMDDWLAQMDISQRALIVETLFDIIVASGAMTFDDVMNLIKKGDISAFREIRKLEPDIRKQVVAMLTGLGKAYIKNRFSSSKES